MTRARVSRTISAGVVALVAVGCMRTVERSSIEISVTTPTSPATASSAPVIASTAPPVVTNTDTADVDRTAVDNTGSSVDGAETTIDEVELPAGELLTLDDLLDIGFSPIQSQCILDNLDLADFDLTDPEDQQYMMDVVVECQAPVPTADDIGPVEQLDPATFQAQGTIETWCGATAEPHVMVNGIYHPFNDVELYDETPEVMDAAFAEELAYLAELEPFVPPELAGDYVNAVNGTRQMQALMVASDHDVQVALQVNFRELENQLLQAWHSMTVFTADNC